MTERTTSTTGVRPSKLAEAIADHIEQLIREGVLQSGDRLISERDLASRLGVSRPSLRDALQKLMASGLLMIDAQGVSYVSDAVGRTFRDPLMQLLESPEGRIHCMEFRAEVEAAAAGYAAERATELDRERLTACMAAMEAAHQTQAVDDIARADAELHFAIYEASHNHMLLHVMKSLEGVLRSNVYVNRHNLYEHRVKKEAQLEEHRAIYEAIMAGDPEAARIAAGRHMKMAIATQRSIHEAEQRLETSIRRLAHRDLVAPPKKSARR